MRSPSETMPVFQYRTRNPRESRPSYTAPAVRPRGRNGKDEVRLRRKDRESARSGASRKTFRGWPRSCPASLLKYSWSSSAAHAATCDEAAHVVAVLHLHHLADRSSCAKASPALMPGKRVGLGERSRDDQPRVVRKERQAGLLGEVDVRLVRNDDAFEPLQQLFDPRGRECDPVRGVGSREEEHLGLRRRNRECPAISDGRDTRGSGTVVVRACADPGQHGIQGVGGIEPGDRLSFPDECLHQHGQDLVGAVAAENLRRCQAVQGRGRRSRRGVASGAGVQAHRALRGRVKRLEHPGRRGIGIFVRVQLHELLAGPGLEPGDVAIHPADGPSDEAERLID